MSFWPFGRDPANIELVSRVITAATQNGYRVRGKLTLHFTEPQRQADADDAADRCSAIAVALLREATDHSRIIGAEAQLSVDLTARCPGDIARVRAVELAALHVVGDPALSDELRRASIPPMTPITTRPPGPAPSVSPPPRVSVPPASMPPPSAPASMRRRGSSQIRSIQSLLMPPGTAPAAMGQFVAPHAKDSAARLLIGFLRAHDLISVRHASIDENSAEMLASLVPVSDAPPGGYEASRSSEIARWQTVLGHGVVAALAHEVRVASVYVAREALVRADVMPALTDVVIEALCAAAFPDEAGLLPELARLPSPIPADFAHTLAGTLTRIAGTDEDPAVVASALAPLVQTVQEDLNVTAMIIKQSTI
jgi:hypothetical protein